MSKKKHRRSREIVEFFTTLPSEQDQARPIIKEKITEIKARIEKIKATTTETGGILNTLEKEFLKSLTSMEKYKGEKFAFEREKQIQAYTNALKHFNDETMRGTVRHNIKSLSKELGLQ